MNDNKNSNGVNDDFKNTSGMDVQIKNYVGIAIILALVVFAISAGFYVKSYADSIGPDSYRSFSVTGEGEVTVVPDVARFSFGVITQGGTNVGALQSENTEKTNAIIGYLKDQGIADEDIKTASYNVEPRQQFKNCGPLSGPCEPAEIVGYTITQRVSVDVHDFEKIGGLLSGVVERGANNVNGPNFTIDDPEEAKEEARAEAIADAKERAQAIADAAGFKVGKLVSIHEGGFYGYGAGGDGNFRAESSASVPKLEPGTQEVTVTVNLNYEIED